jgi:phosphotransferase system enzyme I (PtsI)
MVRGIGTSKGIGIGYALIIDSCETVVEEREVTDTKAEVQRFYAARDEFISDTKQMIEDLQQHLGEKDKTALILQNQIYLINDAEMENGVKTLIENEKLCAEVAVKQTCALFAGIFAGTDSEAVNQRVADIEDLCRRIIDILMGVKKVDLSHLPENTVIIAKELQPSVTAAMDIKHVVGIVSERGGETSHAAILARALEIPAVLSIKDAVLNIKNGDSIIVDGEYGEIFINPIPKTVEIYKKKQKRFLEREQELRQYMDKDSVTKDGYRVCVAANIGSAEDADRAMKAGAEGVGLFRTEFLFMNGTSMPTEEEQFGVYKKAAVICKDRTLTIRTLDIGGDKDIPYMGLTKENNPFLGYRAIRFCLGRVDVFTIQLRAILRASAYGRIRIMIPLVTGVNELRSVREILNRIMKDFDRKEIKYDKDIQLGVMMETPAACIMADVLAKEADFFSIGTNDLTQYTIAVDRGNENVAYLYSAFHPAVLRLIKNVIECAKRENIEVCMCGEAASEPALIPLLLTFGLDEFSVTGAKVLETRKNIASWTMKEAAALTDTVMSMNTEKEIETYLKDYIMCTEL